MDRLELSTVDPGSDPTDLRPLLEMIGDARVVGLGACVHGSHEIHRLKHRIVELLAEEAGFSAVVLEDNLAETSRVNQFVLESRGDAAELLRTHLFWSVCTEEMVELLRWMRAFNNTGRGRVLLAGCDMQRIDTAVEIVLKYLGREAPDLAESVAARYERVLEADRLRWLSGMGVQAWFPVEEARGRRLRFTGYIRTEDVGDHACIWAWAGGADGTLAHDALERRRPRGTTRWREYVIDLDVPEAAQHVSFGCYLAGSGRAWFDGLRIEVEGEPWRNPDLIDLDFTDAELKGFWTDPRNRAALDPETTRTGRPSLCIEPAETAPFSGTSEVEAQALAKQVLALLKDRLSGPGTGRILRCARVIVQALEMQSGGGDTARARSMAENVEWLLDRKPDTRLVLWAPNDHVSRSGGEIGAFLSRSLGDRYVPVAFSTGEGTCLARAPRWSEGIRTHTLAVPPAGSFEDRLTRAGRPRTILDLRTVTERDPDCGFLHDSRLFRNVGASVPRNEFFEQRIRDDFDLLVWLERTTAATPLPSE